MSSNPSTATLGTSFRERHLPYFQKNNGKTQKKLENNSKFQRHQSDIWNSAQRREKWKVKKDKRDTFTNLKMVLTKFFEDMISPAFYSGSRGLATRGLGTTPPVDILANLQRLYGKPSYQELYAALLRLNKPMNILQLVEFMLCCIKEVQLFVLANPEKDRAFDKPNLIRHAYKNRGGVCKGHQKMEQAPCTGPAKMV